MSPALRRWYARLGQQRIELLHRLDDLTDAPCDRSIGFSPPAASHRVRVVRSSHRGPTQEDHGD